MHVIVVVLSFFAGLLLSAAFWGALLSLVDPGITIWPQNLVPAVAILSLCLTLLFLYGSKRLGKRPWMKHSGAFFLAGGTLGAVVIIAFFMLLVFFLAMMESEGL